MANTEITQEQAIKLYESEWWVGLEPRQIVAFQLFTDRLCMPFGDFHLAVEEAIGRPVWTHEFARNVDGIKKEFLGEKAAPSFEEIVALIPPEKRLVLVSPSAP